MSLIVTTSSQDNYDTDGLGIEQPYSYHNYLTQPVVIKPNSKIAVQSVKINRDPTFHITDGLIYYGYITMGENFNTGNDDFKQYYSYVPVPFRLKSGNYNKSQLAHEVGEAFKRATRCHPDVADPTADVKVDGDGNFDGFQINFSQKAIPTDTKSTAITEPQYVVSAGGATNRTTVINFNDSTKTLTGPAQGTSDNMWVIFNKEPLSHADGDFKINCSGALRIQPNDDASVYYASPFAVGLSRPVWTANQRGSAATLKENDAYTSGLYEETTPGSETTPYWQKVTTAGHPMNHTRDTWDFVICTDPRDNTLRMYSQFNQESTANNGKVKMLEVEYWKGTKQTRPADGGATNAVIDLDVYFENGSVGNYAPEITNIDIQLQNERIRVEFEVKGSATKYVMLDETELRYRPPAMGQNQWALYPKFMIGAPVADIHTPQALTCQITEYHGRSVASTFYGGNGGNLLDSGAYYSSFRGFNTSYPRIHGSAATPTRYIDMKNDNDYAIIRAGTANAPQETDTHRLKEFSWGLFVGMDNDISEFISEPRVNIKSFLGFNDNILNNNSDQVTYTTGPPSSAVVNSDYGTKPVSKSSLFVRVNSTTQTSFNAGKSSISKIVYHIPQFSNTGDTTGALYFEPAEKTYLNLNNPNEIILNDIRVDIVDKNEMYATELTGSSVVVLHIKED